MCITVLLVLSIVAGAVVTVTSCIAVVIRCIAVGILLFQCCSLSTETETAFCANRAKFWVRKCCNYD
jgi:hypothetical protein